MNKNIKIILHSQWSYQKSLDHVRTRQPKHNLLLTTKHGCKQPRVTLTAAHGLSSSLSLSRPGKQWPPIYPS